MLGKLSDSRYLKLSRQYEKEQAELEQLASVLEREIEAQEMCIRDRDRGQLALFVWHRKKYRHFADFAKIRHRPRTKEDKHGTVNPKYPKSRKVRNGRLCRPL